jgi:hypothetical protein
MNKKINSFLNTQLKNRINASQLSITRNKKLHTTEDLKIEEQALTDLLQ